MGAQCPLSQASGTVRHRYFHLRPAFQLDYLTAFNSNRGGFPLPRFTNPNNRFVSNFTTTFMLLALLFAVSLVNAQVPVTQISTDTFTNSTSQHETEVEPASYSFGSTIVSVFQIGRFTDGGASDIGFSTSTNGGVTW